MSHLIASKIFITDLDILRKAVSRFTPKLIWMEGATDFVSYYTGQHLQDQIREIGKCEHAIKIPDARYGIGVIRRKDGKGWDLSFDPFDKKAAQIVGRECEKLTTAYSEEFVRDFAEKNGFIINRFTDETGKICMEMTEQ